jgi:hypothetical protein
MGLGLSAFFSRFLADDIFFISRQSPQWLMFSKGGFLPHNGAHTVGYPPIL